MGLFAGRNGFQTQSDTNFIKSLLPGEITDQDVEEIPNVSLQTLSFASPEFKLVCESIHDRFGSADPNVCEEGFERHSLILLFLTETDLARYFSPDIEWSSWTFSVGIVLSRTETPVFSRGCISTRRVFHKLCASPLL
jgi:hypothetical protein